MTTMWNDVTREAIGAACRCVRETPVGDGRKVWDLLTDERSRQAVIITEKYLAGEATDEQLIDAAWAASDAAWETSSVAADAAAKAVWAAAYAVWESSDAAWEAAQVAMYAAHAVRIASEEAEKSS